MCLYSVLFLTLLMDLVEQFIPEWCLYVAKLANKNWAGFLLRKQLVPVAKMGAIIPLESPTDVIR